MKENDSICPDVYLTQPSQVRADDGSVIKMTKVHKRVDARGLACPMPIMKSMQAIKKMRINRVLEILTTDPGSITDIPTWAKATGQELISYEERGPNDYRFLVKKIK
jgi:tRNA 2-thiouridine synthesizing protein A